MDSRCGSTGCRNGSDSGSWRYSFSKVGISACRSSSGLNTFFVRCIRLEADAETTAVLVVFEVLPVVDLVDIELLLMDELESLPFESACSSLTTLVGSDLESESGSDPLA